MTSTRQRHAVGEVQVLEGLEIDLDQHRPRIEAGAGQDPGLVEEIEGRDRRVGHRDGDGAADQRQRDRRRTSAARRAVDARRLVEMIGDALHGREHDDDGQRHHAPDVDDRNGDDGAGAIVEPDMVLEGQAEGEQDAVEQARRRADRSTAR